MCGKVFGSSYQGSSCRFAIKYEGNWRQGEILPILYSHNWLALYKIEGWYMHGSSMDDTAYWDDRREYDMKLVGAERVKFEQDVDAGKVILTVGKNVIRIPREWFNKIDKRFTDKKSEYYLPPVLQALYCIRPDREKPKSFFLYGH